MSSLAIALPGDSASGAYEGPMDVLVALVRRNEFPIDSLPVSRITSPFLGYVRSHPMDDELGGEFVETASWLVLLKSRSLLPASSLAPGQSAAQDELRQAILDFEQVKAAAAYLGERQPRAIGPRRISTGRDRPREELPVTLADVVENTRRALETARAAGALAQSARDTAVTLESQMEWVLRRLSEVPAGVPVSTAEWFGEQATMSGRALLFLALLEHARKGRILVYQRADFADILVKRIPDSQQ